MSQKGVRVENNIGSTVLDIIVKTSVAEQDKIGAHERLLKSLKREFSDPYFDVYGYTTSQKTEFIEGDSDE